MGDVLEEQKRLQAEEQGYVEIGSVRFNIVDTISHPEVLRRNSINYFREARKEKARTLEQVMENGYARRIVLDRAAEKAGWKPNKYGEYWSLD